MLQQQRTNTVLLEMGINLTRMASIRATFETLRASRNLLSTSVFSSVEKSCWRERERERYKEKKHRWIIYVTNKHYFPPPPPSFPARNVINLFLCLCTKHRETHVRSENRIFRLGVRATIIDQNYDPVPFLSTFDSSNQAFGSVPVHKHSTTRFHFYVTAF